jgi:hypothetical protein
MEVRVFGHTVNLITVILSMIVSAVASTVLFCSCSKIGVSDAKNAIQEGLANLDPAVVNYNMASGVSQPPKTWGSYPEGSVEAWKQSNQTTTGTPVPLSEGKLFMWADNKFSPTCCPGAVSNSEGCACISQEQEKYVNQRGGNNTQSTNF